jgi:hypothetical protein
MVMITMVFFEDRMVIESDDRRNFIHCIRMVVRYYRSEFAQHS